MPAIQRALFLTLAFAAVARTHAQPPPDLASALERLRDQKSYSWEVINADPGPVAQQLETRRGTITTVRQNMAPNLKGQIDRNGDTLIKREWSDGLRLDTIILHDGASITKTPEGWMTEKEILTAQAEESIRAQTATPRAIWLRRADRPDVRRPDQELAPFLKAGKFEVNGMSYVARLRFNSSGTSAPAEEGEPTIDVTVTMNLSRGTIRDYEIQIEGTRRAPGRMRLNVAVSEQRIVIITYLPVSRIDIPPEAREKLEQAKQPAR